MCPLLATNWWRSLLEKPKAIKRKVAVYIEKKYEWMLKQLNIVSIQKIKSINLQSLSLTKLSKVNVLLSELEITLPVELQLFVDNLLLIKGDKVRISLEDLKLIGKSELKVLIKELKLFKPEEFEFTVTGLNLAVEIKKYITAQIPNIHLLNVNEQMKYFELIKLLDLIDNID